MAPTGSACLGTPLRLFNLLALLLVAINLRPALTSLGPVLPELGLSTTAAGWLNTLAVLCLGLFAPLAPLLAKRLGLDWALRLALLVLAGGTALRAVASPWALFAGMIAAGAGIGVVGVLLPGVVKRDYPEQAGVMTGLYTMMLCIGAAVAAGTMVPLANTLHSVPLALGVWAIPALAAMILWRSHLQPPATTAVAKPLWGSALAWQVSLYMGFQSSLAYSVFAWLPSMLMSRGLTPEAAGWLTSVSIFLQAPAALLATALTQRSRSQSQAIVIAMLLTLVGFIAILQAGPSWLWPAGIVLGVGQGSSFGLALALLVHRASNSDDAARLSGMAQGVGYALAALGPLVIGAGHDWLRSWPALTPLLAAITLLALLFGALAGRDRTV